MHDLVAPDHNEPTITEISRMKIIRITIKHNYTRSRASDQRLVLVFQQGLVARRQDLNRRLEPVRGLISTRRPILTAHHSLLHNPLAGAHQVCRELRRIHANVPPAAHTISHAQHVGAVLRGNEPGIVAYHALLAAEELHRAGLGGGRLIAGTDELFGVA